eukprot:2612312-Pleurochrysis_carterae.AAC.3
MARSTNGRRGKASSVDARYHCLRRAVRNTSLVAAVARGRVRLRQLCAKRRTPSRAAAPVCTLNVSS